MKRFTLLSALLLTVFQLHAAMTPEALVNLEVKGPETAVSSGTDFQIEAVLNIAPAWHINSNKPLDDFVIPTSIVIDDNPFFELTEVVYPAPKIVVLEALGGKSSTFEGRTVVPVKLRSLSPHPDGIVELTGTLTYQGCNDMVCMAPVDKKFSITIPFEKGEAVVSDLIVKSDAAESDSDDGSELLSYDSEKDPADDFAGKGFLLTLVIVFFGGLALNLTPCVYPLIPITMGFFSSQGKQGSAVLMASMYVLGMAVTYSVLGTFAALTGSMFGTVLANPIVLIFLAALMIALSLSMFGLYEFRLPTALMQIGGGSRGGAVGSLIMGLTMGIVAAPCVGPFVIGLLTYVASTGSPVIGFIMFFTLSLGLGLPYLFLGIFSSRLGDLPRSGEWLNGVRIFFGLALVGMAIYFVLPLLPDSISGPLLPSYMILAALYYAVIDNSGHKSPGFRKGKIFLSMLVLAIGIWLIKPEAQSVTELEWQTWSEENLAAADRSDSPVLIDFFADWCIPCKELDELTFSDPAVQEALAGYELLKVDLTRDKSDQARMLKDRYSILGVPTVIILDKDGNELNSLRLTGFEDAEKFITRLKQVP